MNNGLQTHSFVSGLQLAPMPQKWSLHFSLHRPATQILGATQGLVLEQASGLQNPPANGFPIKPSGHLQVGPCGVTIHCASDPQIYPSHAIRCMVLFSCMAINKLS